MLVVCRASAEKMNAVGARTSGRGADFNLRGAQVLPASFFDRDPIAAAKAVLGKVLVRRDDRGLRAGRLVEVEAYLGADDPAAHAFSGKTVRNAVLFGPPGRAYVYFIYGMYFCLNISCMREGDAGCILVRALEPLAGLEQMARARDVHLSESPTAAQLRQLTSGPGRLCSAFEITRQRDNGKSLCTRRSDLFAVDDGSPAPKIVATPRVGITKAAERPLRFCVAGSEFLSGAKLKA